MLQAVEPDDLARVIEPDKIAHPAEQRDIGDGVVVAHDPFPAVEPGLQHAQQALRLGAVALQRPLVGDLAAGGAAWPGNTEATIRLEVLQWRIFGMS